MVNLGPWAVLDMLRRSQEKVASPYTTEDGRPLFYGKTFSLDYGSSGFSALVYWRDGKIVACEEKL